MRLDTFGKRKVDEVFAELIDLPDNAKFKRRVLRIISDVNNNIYALKTSNLDLLHKRMFTWILMEKASKYMDNLNCDEKFKTYTKNIINTKFKIFLRALK